MHAFENFLFVVCSLLHVHVANPLFVPIYTCTNIGCSYTHYQLHNFVERRLHLGIKIEHYHRPQMVSLLIADHILWCTHDMCESGA